MPVDDVCYVLAKYAELELFIANSLQQWSADRCVTPLRCIILTLSVYSLKLPNYIPLIMFENSDEVIVV
jgi:transcription termination factor NusB